MFACLSLLSPSDRAGATGPCSSAGDCSDGRGAVRIGRHVIDRLGELSPEFPPVLAERYEMVRPIGRGATAIVYLARDRRHGRDIAIKILNREVFGSLGPRRFLREISIVAQLAHPNILPLHDSGEVDGLLYFVMPFARGASLRDRLRERGTLEVAEALSVGCEIASALDCAHRAGIIHRDVKPENVLLVDGHAQLTDFGIARPIDFGHEGNLTLTGMVIGTPLYMSPEQLAGAAVDHRADIYSLGCVVYEMLAGHPPFPGSAVPATIATRESTRIPKVRSERRSVPVEVENALTCALAPVRDDRFPTAAAFHEALNVQPLHGITGVSTASLSRYFRRGPRLRRHVVEAAAALSVICAGVWSLDRGLLPGGKTPLSLAILPFIDLSGDAEYTYLADGLTDALISDLTSVRGLRVTSRSSTMRYAITSTPAMVAGASSGMTGGVGMGGNSGMTGGSTMDGNAGMSAGTTGSMATDAPARATIEAGGETSARAALAQIARELNVDLVMQGSLARTPNSIRVTATVVDARKSESVWSGDYVRDLREVFALQQDLSQAIAGLAARRGPPAERSAEPRSYHAEAHDAYLKGAYFQAHWRLPEAIEAFTEAVTSDPSHAAAHAALARAYYFTAFFGDIAPGIALGAMRKSASAALALDSLLPEAHGQLALVMMLQEWDWKRAEENFRTALELGPSNAQIHHDYAHFLLAMGRQRESLEVTQTALALDPANPMLISCVGWHALFDGRNEEAIVHARESHQMMPDQWAQVVLGWALLSEGKQDEALTAFREAVRLSESAFSRAALGYALAVSGHTVEAKEVATELLARAEREYVSAYDLATIYAGLGDRDETFKWLRRAAEERSTFFVHLAWDLRFSGVRDDERFTRLVQGDLGISVPLTVAAAPRGFPMEKAM